MLFYFFAVSEVGQQNSRIPETIGEKLNNSWLIQVHFNLLQETLYLTVAILDWFLQNFATKIERKQLQLVDVAVMFIASTIIEMWNSTLAHYLHLRCNLRNRQKLADLLLTTQQGPSFR